MSSADDGPAAKKARLDADADADAAARAAAAEEEEAHAGAGAGTGAAAAPAAAAAAAAANVHSTVLLAGVRVCGVGLGTLPAGVAYPDPSARPSAAAFRAIVASAAAAAAPAALFVDCADTYCEPCNNVGALERELRLAAAALPDGAPPLCLSTKSGMKRINSESNGWRPHSAATTPAGVRDAIHAARAAMCGAAPDAPPLFLWSLHHVDALVAPGALEACLAAAVACVAEGALLHIGLCNVTVPMLRRALALTPLATVQNEWSPYQREAEKVRVRACARACAHLAACTR
jgi:pyridoxine 4-dehydrogenase